LGKWQVGNWEGAFRPQRLCPWFRCMLAKKADLKLHYELVEETLEVSRG
jgi:hypothetical protein